MLETFSCTLSVLIPMVIFDEDKSQVIKLVIQATVVNILLRTSVHTLKT